jgi:hypothetical protein
MKINGQPQVAKSNFTLFRSDSQSPSSKCKFYQTEYPDLVSNENYCQNFFFR